MAQEQQQHEQQPEQVTLIKAMFPAPPPFYTNFTKQNVNELRRLRKDAGVPPKGPSRDAYANGDQSEGEQAQKDLDILSLPPELRYLLPPPPPADGTYSSFGRPHSLHPHIPTLADQGIEQLYPSHPSVARNPQPHLIALARSLLTKYLHMLGVLSRNPEEWENCTKDLEVIVWNLQDLINRYRPHQARETLILMMEERVERLRGEIRGIEEGERRTRDILGGFEGEAGVVKQEVGIGTRMEEADGRAKGREHVARQRSAWGALEREMQEG